MLQHSLNSLDDSCNANRMQLNTEKCKILSFTFSRDSFIYKYSIDDTPLHRQTLFRDLGIMYTTNLSNYLNCTMTINKANVLDFIQRATNKF